MSENGNGIKAAEFRGLMLARTEDMIKRLDNLEKKVDCNSTDIAALNVKASIWGGLSGAVVAIVAYLIGGPRQ